MKERRAIWALSLPRSAAGQFAAFVASELKTYNRTGETLGRQAD